MSDLIPVPFRNATLFLADDNGTPYAPMRPIIEGMGLDWKSQYEKLRTNQRLSTCVVEITTQLPGDSQRRKVICLPLRKLPGWLMTIYPNKVKPEIRDTVIAYQNECDDALWDYWAKGQAKNPRSGSSMPDFSSPAEAARAWALEYEAKQAAQQALAEAAPKIAFHDQVTHDSDTLIDFAQAFSLLKRRTGQTFTNKTFLEFLRRHGIACQPNRYANIGGNRFKPRKDYINTWFVSEIAPCGSVEWMLRPHAISAIVKLIENERTGIAMVSGYLKAEDAA